MAINNNRVQVMLSDKVNEELKKAAADDNRTVSDFLRIHIKAILGVDED